MNYRTLGITGLKVSEIGMGTWELAGHPWGWDVPDEKESLRALYRFVDLGGNFVDTAIAYGGYDDNAKLGLHSSEELIGVYLKESGNRDKVIVASKIPGKNRKHPARIGIPVSEVYPKDYILAMVDQSLRSLNIDSIDLMQFHVWMDDFVSDDGWQEAVTETVKNGKVKHWGISVNEYQPTNCIKALDTGLISTVMLIFNIFHQQPIENLFPYAKKNNIGLIARVPFDEGGLTGTIDLNTNLEDRELQRYYFGGERRKQLVEHTDELKKLLGTEAQTLPELALRYILSFDEIATTIPGMKKVTNVDKNTAVSDGRKLSAELLEKLKAHAWERNFYVDVDPALEKSNYLEQ